MNHLGIDRVEASKVASTLTRMGISPLFTLNVDMAWDPTESDKCVSRIEFCRAIVE